MQILGTTTNVAVACPFGVYPVVERSLASPFTVDPITHVANAGNPVNCSLASLFTVDPIAHVANAGNPVNCSLASLFTVDPIALVAAATFMVVRPLAIYAVTTDTASLLRKRRPAY